MHTMLANNLIQCKDLIEEEVCILNALLNQIIPPSEDGKMPGASDVGFLDYINNENEASWLKEVLLLVIQESRYKFDLEFSRLEAPAQAQLIGDLRRKQFRLFDRLAKEVMKCYYQNDNVLKRIQMEARPPFPNGYALDEGDLSLLMPVYERGRIYR